MVCRNCETRDGRSVFPEGQRQLDYRYPSRHRSVFPCRVFLGNGLQVREAVSLAAPVPPEWMGRCALLVQPSLTARGSPSMEAKVRQARERLDAHVRETVAWHFSPDTGTPFWLERAKTLGFDPRKEVQGFRSEERRVGKECS